MSIQLTKQILRRDTICPIRAVRFVRGRGLKKAIVLVHIQTGFDIGERELGRMFCRTFNNRRGV